MNELEYVNCIMSIWPPSTQELQSVIKLAEEALLRFPSSSKLHCIAGDLQLLHDEVTELNLKKSIGYNEKAIQVDRNCAEAYESLGHIYDVRYDYFEKAIGYFRKAIELGAGVTAYAGLARSLAQSGKRDEALQGLSLKRCPFANHPMICKLTEELLDGAWDPIK